MNQRKKKKEKESTHCTKQALSIKRFCSRLVASLTLAGVVPATRVRPLLSSGQQGFGTKQTLKKSLPGTRPRGDSEKICTSPS